jgi:hypothetical protein
MLVVSVLAIPGVALAAGDVDVSVQDGDLVIIGDADANTITVTAGPSPGEFVVDGGATTINGNAGPITLGGIDDDIRAEMGAGPDRIAFESISVPDGVRIDLGDGDNRADLIDTIVGGNLVVYGGDGHDGCAVIGGGIAGDLRLDYGHGGSSTSLHGSLGSTAPDVGGDLLIEAGDGIDNIDIAEGGTTVDGYTHIDIGDGGGYSILGFSAGKLDFEAGAGNDRIDVVLLTADKATFDLGDGDNDVTLSRSTIYGDFRMHADEGRDLFSAGLDVAIDGDLKLEYGDGGSRTDLEVTVWGNLYVWAGNGIDQVTIQDGTVVGGKVKIDTDSGNDAVLIRGGEFDGNVSIKTRDGNDTVNLAKAIMWSNLLLYTGDGADTLEIGDWTTPGSGIAVDGRTRIKLSYGDDLLNLRDSIFEGRFYADGGGGTDIYEDEDTNTFGGKTKVKNFEVV